MHGESAFLHGGSYMNQNETSDADKRKYHLIGLDRNILLPGLVLLMIISFSFLFIDFSGSDSIQRVKDFLTLHLGSFYLIYVFVILIILIYICFSRIGNIRLGDGPPQYGNLSWISMLFCACIGSSILYWGILEWGFYMQAPPFGYEPMSMEAAEISVGYTMFHWGISGWATYCLAAVIIAYFFFVKKIYTFRISVSCGLLAGPRWKVRLGRCIDIFVILGLCSGVAVGVAIGAPMLAQGLYELFGIEPSTKENIVIAIFWSLLFSAATLKGIDKGVKILSNINSVIAIVFIAFIFLVSDSTFILNNFTNSLGIMFQDFIRMSFYTDPIGESGFPQTWTCFYWAWWISYVPVMGLFIAKISRGRTIRQVALGATLLGSLGCWLLQAVLGGYGLQLMLDGQYDMVEVLETQGDYAAIMGLLRTLPLSSIVIFVFIVLAFIFMATTCDSSAYILAALSCHKLSLFDEPPKSARLIWCLASIVWPIILLLVGGIDVVQLCSIIGSIPLLIIVGVMIHNFFKDVKKHLAQEEDIKK